MLDGLGGLWSCSGFISGRDGSRGTGCGSSATRPDIRGPAAPKVGPCLPSISAEGAQSPWAPALAVQPSEGESSISDHSYEWYHL